MASNAAEPVTPSHGSSFVLNETTLREMYTVGHKYVYFVTALRLEEPYDTSPCEGVSRWRLRSSCPDVVSAFDATARQTISNGLAGHAESAVIEPEYHVVDIDLSVSGGGCVKDSKDAPLAGVTVRVDDGTCWEHVHPHTHNVYDFTAWSAIGGHPGGTRAITQFAELRKVAALRWPWTHGLYRWFASKDELPYLGKLGDTVRYDSLPSVLRTADMARAVGAQQSLPLSPPPAVSQLATAPPPCPSLPGPPPPSSSPPPPSPITPPESSSHVSPEHQHATEVVQFDATNSARAPPAACLPPLSHTPVWGIPLAPSSAAFASGLMLLFGACLRYAMRCSRRKTAARSRHTTHVQEDCDQRSRGTAGLQRLHPGPLQPMPSDKAPSSLVGQLARMTTSKSTASKFSRLKPAEDFNLEE